jgi:cation diffusion facilitator family transporter
MSGHHCHHEPRFEGVSDDYKRRLWLVVAINALMFAVEVLAGAFAGSQALRADALDFLGDAATYALSLAVIGAPARTRANAAMLKGLSLAVMAVWVLGSTAYQVFILDVPKADVMGAIGAVALAANIASVILLMRYAEGDANVRSVWLCSRNDAIGNVAVMIAALAVWGTTSAWPDLIVAAIMASLFFWSSAQIVRQSRAELRHAAAPEHAHSHEHTH